MRQLTLARSVSLPNNPRIVCEIERALKEMNIPHTRYSKGEIEGHKLEIQQILRTLHEPNSPLSENSGTGELAPADTRGTAAASVSDSGTPLTSPSPFMERRSPPLS